MTDFAALAAHLADTQTVTIITSRRDGGEVATPIWAAVVDGTPYVRAAYGDATAWFRRARNGGPVWFSLADGSVAERDAVAALDDPRVPVTVERIAADDPVQAAVSAAYEAKYRPTSPEHVDPVVSAQSVAFTFAVRAR